LATAGQSRWSIDGAGLRASGAPAATALALVALAGLGLLLLVRGRARSVIGGLLVLTGAAIVLVDVHVRPGGFFVYSPIGGDLEPHRSVWFWLTAVGGTVLAGGGLLIAIWGHRWPGPRRDYRARAESSAVRRDPWSALDRGEDPTV
jgi:protein-S-isoprenylcysteine O-methyltransferase Ste14